MKNLCLIGAGEIGSRHLQGISLVQEPFNIFIIDKNIDSINKAIYRFNQTDHFHNKKIFYYFCERHLPKEIYLTIVATNSKVRLNILKKLLNYKIKTKYLILEKILFPFIYEYKVAEHIVNTISSKTWVNCSQRYWPFFSELKEKNFNDKNLHINIVGSNWGLACNAIHNLDIVRYLWNSEFINEFKINNEIFPSKRLGYDEISGMILSSVNKGGSLTQICNVSTSSSLLITASSINFIKIWNLASSTLYSVDLLCNSFEEIKNYSPPYQSEITKTIINNILKRKKILLPNFLESSILHKQMLRGFNKEVKKFSISRIIIT